MADSNIKIAILCQRKSDTRLLTRLCAELGYSTLDLSETDDWYSLHDIGTIIADSISSLQRRKEITDFKSSFLPVYVPLLLYLNKKTDEHPDNRDDFDNILKTPVKKSNLKSCLKTFVCLNQSSKNLKENAGDVFRLLIEQNLISFYMFDTNSLLFVNHAMADLFGYRPEEMIGKMHPRDLVHPDDYELLQENVRKRMEGKRNSVVYNLRGIHRDGHVLYGRVFGSTTYFEGRPAILGIIIDLTAEKLAQEKLTQTEVRYRSLFNSAADAILIMDGDRFMECNPATLQMFQCKREEIIGKTPWDFSPLYQPDERLSQEKALELIHSALSGKPQRFHWVHTKKDGTPFDAEVSLNLLTIENKEYLQAIVRDISDRMRSEKERQKTFIALRESEERFRSLVSSTNDMIFTLDCEKRYTGIFGQWREKLNLNPEESIGRTIEDVFGPENAIVHQNPIDKALSGENVIYDWKYEHEGKTHYLQTSLAPLRDSSGKVTGVVGIGRDITSQKEAEINLQRSFEEKSVLLREIHHRVKNNLQIILSMLNLHKDKLQTENRESLNLLENLTNRIHSMSVVYEMLYQDKNLRAVNMSEYIRTIATSLYNSFVLFPSNIEMNLELSPISLGVSRAIPCGLILNELLVNALKYAFPGRKKGKIKIRLKEKTVSGDKFLELKVEDNGVGLPKNFDYKSTDSMGFFLIRILAEDQLGGTVKVRSNNKGTSINVVFKEG